MLSIKHTIMARDKITGDEADELIEEAKEQLEFYMEEGNIEAGMDVCAEFFGLEPDYIMELIP
jgi:hypothetical protein